MKILIIASFFLFLAGHLLAQPILKRDVLTLDYSLKGSNQTASHQLSIYDYLIDFNDKESSVQLKLIGDSTEESLKNSEQFINGNLTISLGNQLLANLKIREPITSNKVMITFPSTEEYLNFKNSFYQNQ